MQKLFKGQHHSQYGHKAVKNSTDTFSFYNISCVLTFDKVSHFEQFLIMHQYKYNTVSVQSNLKRILSDTQIHSHKR